MVRAAAYKEHLNPNRWGSRGKPDYDEGLVEHHTPFGPDLTTPYGFKDENELAEIVLYTDGRISRLRRRYEFRGGTEVEDFLSEHPFLMGPLSDAYEKIRAYFGPRAR